MTAPALRDYQQACVDDLRAAYVAGHRAPLLVLPTGAGKCLAPGTPVLMHDGSVRKVEDVAVGDRLMGPDSRPRLVSSVCSGQEEMYRIVPTKGEPFTVNESHILSLRVMGTCRVTGPDGRIYSPGDTANVSVREWLSASKTFRYVTKGWRAAVDFPEPKQDLPLPPYILGVWLGDGTSRRPEITSVDPEVVSAWTGYAESVGHTVVVKDEQRVPIYYVKAGQGRQRPGSNHLSCTLRRLGVLQNKHIPKIYKTASREARLELLAGILDTDGYATKGGHDIVVKQEKLARDIAFVARSLGFAAYPKPCIKRCTNTGAEGTYWRLYISGDLTVIPFRVPRRQVSERRQVKNVLHFGFRVERNGLGTYYGFELAGPDRLFLLGDFTVTHNTFCFAHIARSAADRDRRVLILVHRQELLRQCSEALDLLDVEHGWIARGHTPTGDRVQVASVQTLIRRLAKQRDAPDLIIVDEAHHAVAGSWVKVLQAYPDAKVLGVTATAARLDGKGLGVEAGGVFDALVEGPNVAELTRRGFLSPAKVYAPPTDIDLSGIRISGGDYRRSDLAERLDRNVVTGCAVQHYRRLADRQPAIAFCCSIEHATHVAEEFQAAGYTAASLDGTLKDSERKRRIRDLGSGRINVLTSCEIVSEGTDIPVVGAAILLRPTKSLALYLQQVGRALRPYPGKKHAIILDHAANSARHGLPDDPRDWSLEGAVKRKGKARERDPLPALLQCQQCFCTFHPAPVCPECGAPQANGGRTPDQVEGELEEIQRVEKRNARREVGRAQGLADLERIAAQRGYKPGWARHVFRARLKKRGPNAGESFGRLTVSATWRNDDGVQVAEGFCDCGNQWEFAAELLADRLDCGQCELAGVA